jgi:hypothetical protein
MLNYDLVVLSSASVLSFAQHLSFNFQGEKEDKGKTRPLSKEDQ